MKKFLKFGDALDSAEKKKIAISMMRGLNINPSWKFVSDVLAYNLRGIESTILDGKEDLEKEDLKNLRSQRYWIKILMNLPDTVIKMVETKVKDIPLDPYDDPIDIDQ